MAFIELRNVHKNYGESTSALAGVTLQMQQGQHYAIQGASGSGKSTLLYILGGLERPSQGQIMIDGRDLAGLDDEELALYRNQFIGFVFQFHFLLPSMSCLENILLPARIGGHRVSEVRKQVAPLIEGLGVEHCLKKYPYQLSGGEQQRVNIVRALSLKPKLLLCDEPTGNLDSENSQKVTQLLLRLATTHNSTLIVVTHDQNVAGQLSQHFRLRDGKLLQAAQPR